MNDPNKNTSNKFLDKVLVTDFAQLALDIYDDPTDSKSRHQDFNQLWVRRRTWSDNDLDYMKGQEFKAGLYVHTATKTGVLSIRGSLKFHNFIEDGLFAFNKDSPIFHGIRTFFNLLNRNNDWLSLKKRYVCGHSLGGILAKYVINTSKCDTITFNAPGVIEYLDHNHCTAANVSGKTVVTYIAKADAIGNFHRDKYHDIGEHKLVDVLNGKQIPEKDTNSVSKLIDDADLDAVTHFHSPIFYHGMVKMYEALKTSEYKDERF